MTVKSTRSNSGSSEPSVDSSCVATNGASGRAGRPPNVEVMAFLHAVILFAVEHLLARRPVICGDERRIVEWVGARLGGLKAFRCAVRNAEKFVGVSERVAADSTEGGAHDRRG